MLNPNIDFNNSPFYVQQELKSWDSPEGETGAVRGQKPRFAAVSAFGAGGSNAHIVIEEYIKEKESIRNRSALGAGSPVGEDNQVMIVLSAKNEE
ncbi:MAG: ketoacyl-synthetase C-terminal extension domain-containing protein, partial [Exilibacterium sp.]